MRLRILSIAALIAGLLLTGRTADASADIEAQIREYDEQIAAFNSEVERHDRNAAAMQRYLDGYKAGGAPLDPGKLQPMGIAGVGVVGAGKNKPQVVQDFINNYESKFNPQNWVGAAKKLNEIVGEKKRLTAKRKKELGLLPHQYLPENEKKAIQKAAIGFAAYTVEIERSKQAKARIKVRIAEIRAKRQALYEKLSDKDKGRYGDGRRAAAPPPKNPPKPAATPGKSPTAKPGKPAAAAKPPAPKPGPKNDRLLIAQLDRALKQLNAAVSGLEINMEKDRAQCEASKSATKPGGGPDTVAGRLKAFGVAARKVIEDMRGTPAKDNAAFLAATRLTESLKTTVDKLRNASDRVCTNSSATTPDMTVDRDGLLRSRNMSTLASQLADKAGDATAALYARFKDVSDIPPMSDIKAKMKPHADALLKYCDGLLARIETPANRAAESQGIVRTIETLLAEAKAGKLTPDLTAAYRDELNKRTSRISLALAKVDLMECQNAANDVRRQCHGKGGYGQIHAESIVLGEDVRAKLVKLRGEQAARVARLAQRIDRLEQQRKDAFDRAQQCHRVAEGKRPPVDPALQAEADRLADPSTAKCRAGDLRNRAAQLRDPKFSGIPGIKGKAAELERRAGIIDQSKADWERARNRYFAGDTGVTRSELDKAEAAINSLGGKPACNTVIDKIARARDKVDRFDNAVRIAEQSLSQCRPDRLRANMRALQRSNRDSKKPHPTLVALEDRMEAQAAVIAMWEQAKAEFAAGRIDAAKNILRDIQSRRASMRRSDCSGLDDKVDRGLDRIATRARARDTARRAVDSCDIGSIKRFDYKIAGEDGKFAKGLRKMLTTGLETCTRREEERQAEDRRSRCTRQNGQGYYPGPVDASGRYFCLPTRATANAWCNANNKGSGWKAGKISAKGGYDCIKPPAVQQAENDASCRRQHGRGYYAGKANKKGVYYCLPTRATANAWCNANNEGSGWKAGKINSRGGYRCNRTRNRQRADNNANCRRKFGAGYYAGRPNKKGVYYCLPTRRTANAWCTRNNGRGSKAGKIRWNGAFNCTRGRTVRQQHDTRSSAAAAAAGAAIIDGVIGAINNSRNSRDRYRPTPRVRQPAPRTRRTPSRTTRKPVCRTHDRRTSLYFENKTDPQCF